ncbi:hypothetical protein [Caulobacter sp. X]|uniref:hypothetical protein n=1 Tax=Caulobacter sp. X TaxID=2048901 RepID=UPI000C146D81|nr:hypothetical protein [Caulobacter sp. X]PIB96374.1 hypothetical protein CSW60_17835 [Caulobacter sp. X]
MFDFILEGRGGQAGAFVLCLDTWSQMRWIAEVTPSVVDAKNRHLALQPANCIRMVSGEEFAALDPPPYRI